MLQKLKMIKNKIIESIVANLPKPLALRIAFYRRFKQRLNLQNPQTLNENIQWLMAYQYSQKESYCADKYYVREFVENHDLGDILPKLYGRWKNAHDIDYNQLPDQFVLKATHGCGYNVICKNRKDLNEENTTKFLNKCLHQDYAKVNIELHYDHKLASIICEEYIDSGEDDILDYKFHCINGQVVGILVCSERSKDLRLNWYNLDWTEKIDYITDEYRGKRNIEQPDNLDEMLCIAKKLSEEFVFVRVDLYNVKGDVKFSELTFTPQAGRIDYFTSKAQLELGKYFNK